MGLHLPAEYVKELQSKGLIPPDPPRTKTAKPRGMNKTERSFAVEFLEPLKLAGEICHWEYETIKLRLADKTWYTPDFPVWLPPWTLIFVETKGGFIRDDAMGKLKIAAEQHAAPFFLAQRKVVRWTIRRMPSRNWEGIKANVNWGV